ncbi:MAG: ROK family transcriptional regulator [Actinobacteria bacterium]|nr:ROK family transcriptional regulator [Actinomycetota bacterium]
MTTRSPRRLQHDSAVLPTDGRRQNLSLVLQVLYTEGAMSRADLARRLSITKVTVSDLVGELLERGQVVEVGQSDASRPGKPAMLVDVDRHGLQVVGLDLTGLQVLRAAVLDLDGTVLRRVERPLSGSAVGEDVVADVLALARDAVALASSPLLGIGVGTPGVVGPDGEVITAPNLGWTDVPLRQLLSDATGLPVLVCNDADAAVHAEHTLGDGGDDVALVRIGLGVGCGLIVNGQRITGAHSAAGEIGHVTVGTDGGAQCSCGNVGCLETWVAAPRLQKALAEGPDDDAPLRAAGERLGIALAPVVAALDLSEVVISGPHELVEGALLASVDETLRRRMLARNASSLQVRVAADPDDIVLRGAGVLVLWDQWGVT